VGEDRTFEVRHVRDTRQGPKPLTDERDIYELEANQAARRVRACILALIDGDVIEAAIDQCTRTLETKVDVTPDGIKRMLEAFAPFKVNQRMLEARIGRNLSSITPAQMVGFKNILNGLKDGMSAVENWFDKSLADQGEPEKNDANAAGVLKEKVKAATQDGKSDKISVEEKTVAGLGKKGTEAVVAIDKALQDAKTVDDVDSVWNSNTTWLTKIKEADEASYKELDGIYLKRREVLENNGKKPKTLV
jgi:hypothetical protein